MKWKLLFSQILLGLPVYFLKLVGFVPLKSSRPCISKLAKIYMLCVHVLIAGFCINSIYKNISDGHKFVIHIYVSGKYIFVLFLQGFILLETYSINSLFHGNLHTSLFKDVSLKNFATVSFIAIFGIGIILAYICNVVLYHTSIDYEGNKKFVARFNLDIFNTKLWTYFIVITRKFIFIGYIAMIRVMVNILIVNSAISLCSKFHSIVKKLRKIRKNDDITNYDDVPKILEEFQYCRRMVQNIDSKFKVVTTVCLVVNIININLLYYGRKVYYSSDWSDDIHKMTAEIFLFLIITLIPTTIHSKVS